MLLAQAVVAIPPQPDVQLTVTMNPPDPDSEPLLFNSPPRVDEKTLDKKVLITADDLLPVPDPLAKPPQMLDLDLSPKGKQVSSDREPAPVGLAPGRQPGMKKKLLEMYDGTAGTEKAVEDGLKWLVRFQLDDDSTKRLSTRNPLADPKRQGSWSLRGPFTRGVPDRMDNPAAATAMALMAFQGAGNTPKKGPFGQSVHFGWKWLLAQQDDNGSFFHEGPRGQRYYTDGQCAIALCELYAMTKDPQYKEPAERAIKCLLDGQSKLGGWKYEPRGGSDISVTGWVVMALQSAKMAGLDVPPEAFDKIQHFLDSIDQDDGSRYPYERPKPVSLAMTAEALLMRQYMGWRRDDPRLIRGAGWITSPENLINFDDGKRDVYYWYYATQVARHMDDEFWDRWNGVMREEVPKHQVQTTLEKGSWDPKKPSLDEWSTYGGRLYVTCMSIYLLEVYYRHMPLYRRVY